MSRFSKTDKTSFFTDFKIKKSPKRITNIKDLPCIKNMKVKTHDAQRKLCLVVSLNCVTHL